MAYKINREEIIECLVDRDMDLIDDNMLKCIFKEGLTGHDEKRDKELIENYVFYFDIFETEDSLTFVKEDGEEVKLFPNECRDGVNWKESRARYI